MFLEQSYVNRKNCGPTGIILADDQRIIVGDGIARLGAAPGDEKGPVQITSHIFESIGSRGI